MEGGEVSVDTETMCGRISPVGDLWLWRAWNASEIMEGYRPTAGEAQEAVERAFAVLSGSASEAAIVSAKPEP